VHERIRQEVDRLNAWRDRVAPLADSVRISLEHARLRAASIGQQIQEAVDPMNEAIADLDQHLAAVAEVSGSSGPSEPSPGPAPEPSPSPPVIELRGLEDEPEPAGRDDPAWRVWR
jgi:hypothetical protein